MFLNPAEQPDSLLISLIPKCEGGFLAKPIVYKMVLQFLLNKLICSFPFEFPIGAKGFNH